MATLDNVRLFVIDALKKYHTQFQQAHNQALADTLADYATYTQTNSYYVAQEAGKGLSTEDFTTAYMTKLDGIAVGAQVNVKANWNETDSTSDAYIQNKPDLTGFPTYAYWDSTNHNIIFQTASNGTVLSDMTINGADFIIDGMIDSVSIENYTGEDITTYGASYLYIDFNTAAENNNHTDIKIPLQDIFNPNNYYDKTTSDGLFATYTYLGNNFYTKTEIDNASYITSTYLGTNYYTKTESDGLFPTYTYTNANYTTYTYVETYYPTYTYVESNYPTYTYLANTYTTFAYTQAAYAYIMATIEENEEVVAAALADINDRLNDAGGSSITTETQLSLANVSKPADASGYTYIIGEISVSDHTITPTYVGVLNTHQDISGKEDTTNKKNDLKVAANISSTYYATTYSVISYVGSLDELSTAELNDIFGITSEP